MVPSCQTTRFHAFAGPLLIALATLIMLLWSWGTWPDPLVDFGGQLYVPWQLDTGHVLYRDVTYYNGPLSSYFNAAAFRIFGVGLHTLLGVNLVILIATMVLAYQLTVRASGRLSATIAGLTFALVFAFGQIVRLGNYNWITPYHHELTHGAALALAAIACVARYQRTDRKRWIVGAGALLGAVFLTKAEPTAAGFAAVAMQLIAGWWTQRTSRKNILISLGLLIGCTIVAPIIAWILLATAMPVNQALQGVLGSWPWAMDSRITSLHFYREVAGLNDIRGNLRTMLNWSALYATLLALGFAGAFVARTRRAGITIAVILFTALGALIAWRFNTINWSRLLTPLPICLGIIFIFAMHTVFRRVDDAAPLRLSLVVFASLLVAKMGLTARPFHYGFVLAWPGTMVLVCIMTAHLPNWINRHGGSGIVMRGVGLAVWIAAIWAMLGQDATNFNSKKLVMAKGTADEFRGNAPALEVRQVCEEINQLVPPGGTVMVLPQGLMINYLARRETPTRYVNFMPPEVLAAGEQTILSALKNHPPDAVVLTATSIQNGHFTLDGQDPYGGETLNWVTQNYQFVDQVELPKPLATIYRFIIMEKRKP